MRQTLSDIWRAALNFIYPPSCMLCKIALPDAPGLCRSCRADLVAWNPARHRVSFMGKFEQVFILYDFDENVKTLIHQLKYQGKTRPGRMFGQNLSEHIAGALDLDTVIVPVPLHSSKKRERGYNQSEIIARAAGRALGWSVMTRALKRVKATQTQTQLNVKEREKNVKRAFRVCNPAGMKGRKVILVDDVITTGATLDACARVLMDAGAQSVSVGAVACPKLSDELLEHTEEAGY